MNFVKETTYDSNWKSFIQPSYDISARLCVCKKKLTAFKIHLSKVWRIFSTKLRRLPNVVYPKSSISTSFSRLIQTATLRSGEKLKAYNHVSTFISGNFSSTLICLRHVRDFLQGISVCVYHLHEAQQLPYLHGFYQVAPLKLTATFFSNF